MKYILHILRRTQISILRLKIMSQNKFSSTIDPLEIANFNEIADEWWNPEGKFKPLHQLNYTRLKWIRSKLIKHFSLHEENITGLNGISVLDVGCGGGLISEPISRMGCKVLAIDAGNENIHVAKKHAEDSNIQINYQCTSAETLALSGQTFDVVLALEIVEHVLDLKQFLLSLTKLTKREGILIISTLNRTTKSFIYGILGAEYVMRWLPRGTHRWDRFVKPSELNSLLELRGFYAEDMIGLKFNTFKFDWELSSEVSVNYMFAAVGKVNL